MASDGYRNFRLRGIPESFQNRKQVCELVRTALRLEEDAEIAVHSLARNPLERCSRIATLTFENNIPNVLEGPQTEWIFTVPGSDEDEAEKWGPQRLVFDTHFRGFTPLHRADDSECSTDLIAISGLAGHAFGSFKARGSSFMWLRDDLPVRLRRTRILVYGYDTKVVASSSFQNLNDLGNMFRYSVKRLQLGSSACCQIRPTIFLGHSLGGLVVKEAIMRMKGSKKVEDREFLDNIIAFVFFGVPHQGMATEHLFPVVGEQPNRSLIQSFGKHSAILQRYEEEFSEALDTKEPRPEILSFYETEMSPTAKFNEEKRVWEFDESRLAVLVDRSSATNGCTSGCAIARNHSEMVKFTSEMDEMYDIVLASLLPLLDGHSS